MYINNHTYYSLRYGTYSEEELLRLAGEFKIKTLALTDIHNTSGCLNFVRLAHRFGVRPVLGVDFRRGARQEFLGIARNNEGFYRLNEYLSSLLHSKEETPDRPTDLPGRNVFVIYPFSKVIDWDPDSLGEHELVGVKISDLNRLRFSRWKEVSDKLVALHTCSFRHKKDYNAHRLLRAIDNNTLLSKLPIEQQGKFSDLFLSPEELTKQYEEFSFLLKNSQRLLEKCFVHFDFSENRKPKNQETYTGSQIEDSKLIKKLCLKGLGRRYGKRIHKQITSRLKKELQLIEKMNFTSYFLMNWDICHYAREKGYFYVGRGSGANSIVAYLLFITDVDPIDLDLYFERFINLFRANPPDFDIDFSWKDREDVTRYIFNRFNHVSLLATYNTFNYKGAVREIGKVFGLPKAEIDVLSSGNFQTQQLDKMALLVLRYAALIQGMPNHLGIHAGGILIAEKSLHHYSATFMPPKGFATVQFDMVIAEDVGLYKFDILGQRGLAKIKDSLDIIKENQPEKAHFDIHNIQQFKEDERINNMIKEAQCLGCFYVESPAMRMLLNKLKVDNYLGLVAASSIIRPGVAKSGMMREYILRHKDPKRAAKMAEPILLDIMPETYGVMVYQEDVIRVAHLFAGLDLGEADVLRRGMSGKYRSRDEFYKVKEKFFSNSLKKGYTRELTAEIWRQIESFAGYAFAKGHSASYAVESYQTLFLKTYFPLEYMVAVLNNGGGFYRPEIYVHEARMLGAQIHAPCVNHSRYATCIHGVNIYLGFQHLHELETKYALLIVEDRIKNGVFKSLDDFIERIPTSIEQISILIRIGGFRFTGIPKKELLWKAHFSLFKESRLYEQKKLFYPKAQHYKLPALKTSELEAAFDEIELLGFPLGSPFALLEDKPKNKILAKDLPQFLNKSVDILGYMVTVKHTSTSGKKRMYFGTFLDQMGHFIDTVHFPPVAARYPFRGKGIYMLTGRVVCEFGFYSLEIQSMEKLAYIQDPRYKDENPSKAVGF